MLGGLEENRREPGSAFVVDTAHNWRVLDIPTPAVVLLIGPSGSGKTTFAHRHFGPYEVVSSDRCRAMISDDEGDQSSTAEAFELLRVILRKRIAFGRLTVVDATNVKAHARARSLEIAAASQVPAVAIVFDVSARECVARSSRRPGRLTDKEVIMRQHDDLVNSMGLLPDEGYAYIHVISAHELGTVRIARIPTEDSTVGRETDPDQPLAP